MQLDATLIEDIVKVEITTEYGNIRTKEVIADQINLISDAGDITTSGILDGNITVETGGDGDFLARGDVGIHGER